RADDAVRAVLLRQPLGRAVRAAAQAMHVLAEDDDARVLLHPAVHRLRDGLDEGDVPPGPAAPDRIGAVEAGELGGVAADAGVDDGRIRPQLGTDAAAAR